MLPWQHSRSRDQNLSIAGWTNMQIFFKVHIDLEKKPLKRKNKAPQSQRTSIVIAIVFLKQRSVCIMK